MKKLLSVFNVLSLCALTLVGCNPQDEAPVTVFRAKSAYTPYGQGEETPLRWADAKLSGGLALKISDQVVNDFSLDNGVFGHTVMAQAWNEALPSKLFFSLPMPVTPNREKTQLIHYFDDEMGIYKSVNWFSEVGPQALAITQFFGLRKQSAQGEYIELQHADVILNYKDYGFSSDTEDFFNYDLPSVLLHEMGHFIGLRHELDTYESVMRPSLGSFESERSLYPQDVENLEKNYFVSGSNNLEAASTGIQSGAIRSDDGQDSETVRGHFELRSDGECRHIINGKLTHTHKLNISFQK